MDWQEILTSSFAAVIVLFLGWIVAVVKNAIKKAETRERHKEQRMVQYFRKTDAIIYAFAVSSEQVVTETFQRAYEQKMAELEKENTFLN